MFGMARRLEANGPVYSPGRDREIDGNVFFSGFDGFLRQKCTTMSGSYHVDDGGQIRSCADHIRV